MRLIDADALINDILTDYGCDPKYIADETIDGLKPYTDQLILDRIGLQPTIASPRWVRCEDDKPKERDYYFAFTADAEAFVGEYIPSVDQWWNGDDLILTVTHWMPIEPPREGE